VYVECKVEDIGVLERRLRGRTPLRSQRMSVEEPPVDAIAERHFVEDGRTMMKRKIENPVRPTGDGDGDTMVIVVDSSRRAEECVEKILEQIRGLTEWRTGDVKNDE